MRQLLLFTIATFLIQSVSFSQDPVVQAVINQTNIDSLSYFVKELSGEVQTIIGGTSYTILSRNKYQPGNDLAANYIKQKFESYGLTAYDQWWSSTGRNVYAVQPGTLYPNKKYIICAHYDDMPSGTTAPGADDNASGTAAVIEAARIFSHYSSKYTIIYALWDEEEQGLVGSDYYAHQAYLAGDSIMGVVNLDMIAYDSNSNSFADLHTKSVATSIFLKDKMIEVNNLYNLGIVMDVINPGSGGSDHWSFWNYNFGAILLIEDYSDFNAYYHSINDKIQYFNLPFFLKMSKTAIGTIAALAEMSQTVPVELLAFTASVKGSEVQLDWSTATELNNHRFEIERSLNVPNDFVTVGYVEGKGTSTEINYYSFTDQPDLSDRNQIFYRIKQVDYDGTFSYSNIINVTYEVPKEFVLNQNYPNPFNPTTRIIYFVPKESMISIKVFDFLGREVATLVNEMKTTGSYELSFDATNLSSGIYFYTLTAKNFSTTKKMMLLR